jgi:hypothetical protein
MNTRRVSLDDSSDGFGDTDQRDRTLRALEGRTDDEYSQFSPPESAYATPDENTSELFMRIANEDPSPQRRRESGAAEEYSGPALVSDLGVHFLLHGSHGATGDQVPCVSWSCSRHYSEIIPNHLMDAINKSF